MYEYLNDNTRWAEYIQGLGFDCFEDTVSDLADEAAAERDLDEFVRVVAELFEVNEDAVWKHLHLSASTRSECASSRRDERAQMGICF